MTGLQCNNGAGSLFGLASACWPHATRPTTYWSSGSAAGRSMPRVSRSARAFWFGGDGAAAMRQRDALIRETARAAAGARGARRVRVLGREPQAPPGVDPAVRPGAAERLSRHRRGLRLRSRGAGAGRRRHAARGGCGAGSDRADLLLSTAGACRVDGGAGCRGRGVRAAGGRGAARSCATTANTRCEFARKHRDIIAKFGRFPHRNRVLGRDSTPAEIEWLAAHGEQLRPVVSRCRISR